jgi:hypothetical protein
MAPPVPDAELAGHFFQPWPDAHERQRSFSLAAVTKVPDSAGRPALGRQERLLVS